MESLEERGDDKNGKWKKVMVELRKRRDEWANIDGKMDVEVE